MVVFLDKNKDACIQPYNEDCGATPVGPDGTPIYSEIIQENHYYPFGMQMEGPWDESVSQPENKYLYNGKELNEDFGLDWLDYGARWYDPSIGRWGQIDPLAEADYSWSPYNYVRNSPILLIDPDGRKWVNPYEGKEGYETEARIVRGVLNDLKSSNEELYNYVNNLSVTDKNGNTSDIRVNLFVSHQKDGADGQEGSTLIGEDYSGVELTTNSGKNIHLPRTRKTEYGADIEGKDMVKSSFGNMNVILYRTGQNDNTLANEAGDVMFQFEENEMAIEVGRDTRGADSTTGKSNDIYSRAVEQTHVNRKKGNISKSRAIYPLYFKRGRVYTKDGEKVKNK